MNYALEHNDFSNDYGEFCKIDDDTKTNENISMNIMELEIFNSIPKELTKEKKMSLLIVVLLQMVFGSDENFKLKKIYKFLNKNNILDMEVIHSKYHKIRNSLGTLVKSVNNMNSSNDNAKNLGTNKYRTNFNQVKLLGMGSYGSVYKAFHKYEKKFYAIKKVFVTSDHVGNNYDIFREIQVYADLAHENIVRYFGSWVEIDLESIYEYNDLFLRKSNKSNKSIESVNSNALINFDPDDFEKIKYLCPVLFIQMELCDFTLGDYLMSYCSYDSINDKIDIIIQIIKGLKYLKQKNIIHRDIKPDNIFLQISDTNTNINISKSNKFISKYIVKLGDFGLCKKNASHNIMNIDNDDASNGDNLSDNPSDSDDVNDDVNDDDDVSDNDNASDNEQTEFEIKQLTSINNYIEKIAHDDFTSLSNSSNSFNLSNQSYLSNQSIVSNVLSSYFGTGIYRAPEINTGQYDIKIDIYSLGIIMLELFMGFTTQSEKIYTLMKIQKNEYDALNTIKHSEIIEIIIGCLNSNPTERMELNEIEMKLEIFLNNFKQY